METQEKLKYKAYQVDAWGESEIIGGEEFTHWYSNQEFYMFDVEIEADASEESIILEFIKPEFLNEYMIEDSGNFIEIREKETYKPIIFLYGEF